MIDTDLGNVVAGGAGVEGDVVVLDAQGRLAIVLDAADGAVVVGGQETRARFASRTARGRTP